MNPSRTRYEPVTACITMGKLYKSVKNERLLKKYTFFDEKSTIILLFQKNILPLHRKLKPYYYESGENTID